MTIFDNELRDMTDAALDAIPAAFPVHDRLVTEHPYGPGRDKTFRTDLAGVQINSKSLAVRADRFHRQSNGDGTVDWQPLSHFDVKSYLMMRRLADDVDGRLSITRDQWRDRCRWSHAWKKAWKQLADKSFVQLDDSELDDFGFIIRRAEVVDIPPTGDAWAFELKPRDWQHALVQAARSRHGRDRLDARDAMPDGEYYRENPWVHTAQTHLQPAGYANYAVVIMDQDHIGPAEHHVDVFDQLGVGLAALDRDGIDVVTPPRRVDQDFYTRARLYLNERTLPRDFEL